MPPVEPPPSVWDFPPATAADRDGVVALGADLEPGTVLAAYRSGIFPMPLHRHGPMAWWSPNPRGIIPVDRLRVSRSVRRSSRRFEIRIDTAFDEVVRHCADPTRPHGWITDAIRSAYAELHRMGWAHSVESYQSGTLVGGLYGVAIGGLFAGESMFHHRTDASKVALVALVERLTETGSDGRLLDVQWATPHLVSLGAVEVPARRYLELLVRALAQPLPPAFAG